MSEFVTISIKDFEAFLMSYSSKAPTVFEQQNVNEVIYEISTEKPTINIRIYSSIDKFANSSRFIGEDAIRCVLVDFISQKPIDKAKRTHRMTNWRERLKEKLDELKQEVKKIEICKSCNSAMVLREGTKGQFYGCLSYPTCKSTMNLFGEFHSKSSLTEPQNEIVHCPECDALMQKRSGRKGEFYGCSNFFKTGCKGVREVRDVEIYGQGIEDEPQLKLEFEMPQIKKEQPKKEVEQPAPAKQIEIVKTSSFPHMKFKFENFNPVQSEVFQYYNKDVNCVVAASTSAGKTTVAEMFMSDSISRGKKAIFLSPLKAVSQEKYQDWTDPKHDWSKLNISIVTGDYQLTEERVKELNAANIIIMTTEMLDSRTRRITIESNSWLLEAGTIVQDEAHLLCIKGRGDKAESAIMRFTKQNPSCRIVFLSATMQNVDELSRWLSCLNKKKTELINSNYRPIQLDIHYEPYDDYGKYQAVESNKIQRAVEIALSKFSLNEQVLIFVHSKKMGSTLLNAFLQKGIDSSMIDFHSGDLDLKKRLEIEAKTRSRQIKILIATSTLAWGINI